MYRLIAALIALVMVCAVAYYWKNRPVQLTNPSRELIESELAIDVRLVGAETIQAGESPRATVNLVNMSRRHSHRVIPPCSGYSDVGWRKPAFYCTATIDRGNGKFVPFTDEKNIKMCGTVTPDEMNWINDVEYIQPGKTLECYLPDRLDFQYAGRVRLQVHYKYEAEPKGTQYRFKPTREELALIEGLPTFELHSNVIEFNVEKQLDIQIKVKKAMKVNTETKLSDLIDVQLVNQANWPIDCSWLTEFDKRARLSFEIDRKYPLYAPWMENEEKGYAIKSTLEPSEKTVIYGSSTLANGIEGTWVYPKEDRVKLRVVFTPTTYYDRPHITSNWVEIDIVK